MSIFGGRTPAELNIPTETQIYMISSLIYVGIRGFCTTGCGMISFLYLLLTMVASHRYHAPTILTTAHLSPGPPGILPRVQLNDTARRKSTASCVPHGCTPCCRRRSSLSEKKIHHHGTHSISDSNPFPSLDATGSSLGRI